MRYAAIVLVLLCSACRHKRATVTAPPADAKGGVRYTRFEHKGKPTYGILEGNRLRILDGSLLGSWKKTDETVALSSAKLLPPTDPPKVLALAGNYKSHLGDNPMPKNPEVFFKARTAVIAHGDEIVIPKGTADCHFELELVIVMGKKARNVEPDKALDTVLGITCGNDVSARDWQKGDVQWWRAKGSDTFAPCGPFIASGIDYNNLQMELRHNGTVKQKQTSGDMIFDVAKIVSFISKHLTLEPGDLIFTGTPGKTEAMKPGDVVEVEIEGVGVLRNKVVAGK